MAAALFAGINQIDKPEEGKDRFRRAGGDPGVTETNFPNHYGQNEFG